MVTFHKKILRSIVINIDNNKQSFLSSKLE